uniref:Receptor-type tyrosine-protein phosphatase C n=1 Tax=Myripristis murdjan TaxID=586833 RepID=A0A667XMC8_9TELE
SSIINMTDLKPSTNYNCMVSFKPDSEANVCTACKRKGHFNICGTFLCISDERDINEADTCIHGQVCYASQWDISSAMTRKNYPITCQSGPLNSSKAFCFTPKFDDICSNLTTNFSSGNVAFNKTSFISVENFLNQSEIEVTPPATIPENPPPTISENFNQSLPSKCQNLKIDYTCHDLNTSQDLKPESKLEPFTEYNCTGQIMDNNVSIDKSVTTKFMINCDLKIVPKISSNTSSSIELEWNTSSVNCPGVSKHPNLSYVCRCNATKPPVTANRSEAGGTCNVIGLEPYTFYTCTVQPIFNGSAVHSPTEAPRKQTDPGRPKRVNDVRVILKDNNAFTVNCSRLQTTDFHGPHKKYIARVYAGGKEERNKEAEENCSFEFTDLSYSTDYTLNVTAYNGHHESAPSIKYVSTRYNDRAVIGFLVFLIILTSVALIMVLYKIFILQRRKSLNLGEDMMLIPAPNEEENLMNVEPIAAEVLLDAYKSKIADEGRFFLAEFQSIPRIFSRNSLKDAKKPCNAVKNRYVDILPYDFNRVQLTTGNGEAGCDYINASFIDGFKESKKYIAAQGPKVETVSDFWRMIWEQQSSIIVMVTRCEEGNRIKCAQYWPSPDRETEIFDEFIVKLNGEDCCPDYIIRHLSLTNKRDKNSEREVTQIQFTSWPDHGVPGEPHLLLKLRRRVNAFKNFFSGPIVVHCSAGVGRTGTYIGIDAMMEGLEAEGRVDIYGYVVRLRRQRCLMVQVEAQYILIHQALIEYNQFGETEIALSELHSTLGTLKEKNSSTEPTLLEEEFERVPKYKNWRTFNTGIAEENKKKNRDSSVIPYDYNRVLLKIDEGSSHDSDQDDDEEESSDEEDEESTKYINASHIDGYWGPRSLIAAQGPLPDTTADFWLMVYQKKASTIVMLSECKESDKEVCSAYWDNEKKTFGDIEVELTATDTSPTFITRTMQIRHTKRKDSRQVKQFHFLKWVNRELPEKTQDLTDMIKSIKQTRHYGNSKSEKSTPVVVHCSDGSSRSGIFCALWNLLDSAATEKLVDVFQVSKSLRKERQGMITSLEQYQFLYDALEGAFPVQNGEANAVPAATAAPAVDSVKIENETKAAEKADEKQEEQPASSSTQEQQGAAESTPLVAKDENEAKQDGPDNVSSSPTESTPLEGASNGPTVTLEV